MTTSLTARDDRAPLGGIRLFPPPPPHQCSRNGLANIEAGPRRSAAGNRWRALWWPCRMQWRRQIPASAFQPHHLRGRHACAVESPLLRLSRSASRSPGARRKPSRERLGHL